jgi:hypothetical protein
MQVNIQSQSKRYQHSTLTFDLPGTQLVAIRRIFDICALRAGFRSVKLVVYRLSADQVGMSLLVCARWHHGSTGIIEDSRLLRADVE